MEQHENNILKTYCLCKIGIVLEYAGRKKRTKQTKLMNKELNNELLHQFTF